MTCPPALVAINNFHQLGQYDAPFTMQQALEMNEIFIVLNQENISL